MQVAGLAERHHQRIMIEERGYTSECWTWLGSKRDGYGLLRDKGRVRNAHIVFYEEKFGPMPEGLQADHLCRQRDCVNPDHIEPVTTLENTRRGERCKLTPEEAREAKYLAGRIPQNEIARRLRVHPVTINDLLKGRTWKDV